MWHSSFPARFCTEHVLFSSPRGLDNIQASRRHSILLRTVNLKEMISCLEDLINYFAYPEEELGRPTLLVF